MRKYDILFLDIDGTLVQSDHKTISPRTREALKKAKAAGVKLVVATGRARKIMPEMLLDLDFDYVLSSNGAAVDDLHTGERIYYNPFDAKAARIAYELIKDDMDFIEFFVNGGIGLSKAAWQMVGVRNLPEWHNKYFATGDAPIYESEEAFLDAGAPGLEKIGLVRYPKEVLDAVYPKLQAAGIFNVAGSIKSTIELNQAGCTKGVALKALCEKLGIDIARAAAMGDAGNDADMLKAAGCGVAMGNAKPEIKAIADQVTATNDEDGVALFIENYVL